MSRASLAALVHTAQFRVYGETLIHLPSASEPYEFAGIWREDPILQAERQGVQASVFTLWASLTPEPKQRDRIMRGEALYLIAADPSDSRDDSGGVTLYLRRA